MFSFKKLSQKSRQEYNQIVKIKERKMPEEKKNPVEMEKNNQEMEKRMEDQEPPEVTRYRKLKTYFLVALFVGFVSMKFYSNYAI